MRTHARWILTGVCVIAALQVLISLAFTAFAYVEARSETAPNQGVASVVVFGLTLGGFLMGGFAIGRLSEQARAVDAAVAGFLTLSLSAVVYLLLPEGNKGQFVIGNWLANAAGQMALTGRVVTFVGLSLVAAGGGAYLGWRLTGPLQSDETSISPERQAEREEHRAAKAAGRT